MANDPIHTVLKNVAVGTTTDDSDPIDLRGQWNSRVAIPSGSSITSLTLYEAIQASDTQAPEWYECGEASATLTVAAGKTYAVPDKFYACGLVKLVGDAAGVVHVMRKG